MLRSHRSRSVPLPILYDEFTASTVPDPKFFTGRVIYRTDLQKFYNSDGVNWLQWDGGAGSSAAEDITIADAGGYYTGTDVEAALQELGAVGFAPTVQPFYFSGAGTYPVIAGPGTAYSLFLTSFPNLATVAVYNNTTNTGPTLLATVTNGTGLTLVNYPIQIGSPPNYGAATTGITLDVGGVTVGYLTWSE